MAREMERGGHGYVMGHLCGAKLKTQVKRLMLTEEGSIEREEL